MQGLWDLRDSIAKHGSWGCGSSGHGNGESSEAIWAGVEMVRFGFCFSSVGPSPWSLLNGSKSQSDLDLGALRAGIERDGMKPGSGTLPGMVRVAICLGSPGLPDWETPRVEGIVRPLGKGKAGRRPEPPEIGLRILTLVIIAIHGCSSVQSTRFRPALWPSSRFRDHWFWILKSDLDVHRNSRRFTDPVLVPY
jgi:hypothetical protein